MNSVDVLNITIILMFIPFILKLEQISYDLRRIRRIIEK